MEAQIIDLDIDSNNVFEISISWTIFYLYESKEIWMFTIRPRPKKKMKEKKKTQIISIPT